MERKIDQKLVEWKDSPHRKPLILKGARQTGKTFALMAFGSKYFNNFHYLNFEESEAFSRAFEESLEPRSLLANLSFVLGKKIEIETDLLILDEIQACPRALTSLKYFCEQLPQMAVCAAGSLLGVMLGEAAYPVGKADYLRLYPMSFEEFLKALHDDPSLEILEQAKDLKTIPEVVHAHLWERLKIYFVVGGLPEVVLTYVENKEDSFEAMTRVRNKQGELVLAYLADIAKHSGKENSMHIERIWRNVPAQLARTQDGSAPKFKFKGVVPNVQGYDRLVGALDWLQAAGLIIRVPITHCAALPLSAYIRENQFKLYCFDVGILGVLGHLPPAVILDYDYGSFKGYFAENFVAQEFLSSGQEALFSWKENTAEIEFLREVGGAIIPVEVKSGWVTQAKSLKVFVGKYNPPFSVILSGKNLHISREGDAQRRRSHHYPLYLASRFPWVD